MSSNRTQVAVKLARTVDFGAPAAGGEHMFRVEIPGSRKDPVLIVEDFGIPWPGRPAQAKGLPGGL